MADCLQREVLEMLCLVQEHREVNARCRQLQAERKELKAKQKATEQRRKPLMDLAEWVQGCSLAEAC